MVRTNAELTRGGHGRSQLSIAPGRVVVSCQACETQWWDFRTATCWNCGGPVKPEALVDRRGVYVGYPVGGMAVAGDRDERIRF